MRLAILFQREQTPECMYPQTVGKLIGRLLKSHPYPVDRVLLHRIALALTIAERRIYHTVADSGNIYGRATVESIGIGGIVLHAKIVFEQLHHTVECALVAAAAYIEYAIAVSEAESVLSKTFGRALTDYYVALLKFFDSTTGSFASLMRPTKSCRRSAARRSTGESLLTTIRD